jgi:hypothetical protein
MFSVIFTASAVAVDETEMTFSTTEEYKTRTKTEASDPCPATIFGIVAVVNREFPGSSRSGEYARKKSVPEYRPVASRIGFTISSVVPGQVVKDD